MRHATVLARYDPVASSDFVTVDALVRSPELFDNYGNQHVWDQSFPNKINFENKIACGIQCFCYSRNIGKGNPNYLFLV